jgi:hypothetical protein
MFRRFFAISTIVEVGFHIHLFRISDLMCPSCSIKESDFNARSVSPNISCSSLQIIGKSLGHKSTQSTSIYAKLDLNSVRDSMQRATHEIQKMINH